MPISSSSQDANPAEPNSAGPVDASQEQDPRPPMYAWLLPLAGLAALIGALLPWFHGYATKPDGRTVTFHGSISSWNDGRAGLLPGVLLTLMAFAAAVLLLRPAKRRHDAIDTGPVVKAARQAAIAGGVSLVCLLYAYLVLPQQYSFGGKSWTYALGQAQERYGYGTQFHRGPQVGFWLTLAAATVALVAGCVLLVRLRNGPGGTNGDASPFTGDRWALPTETGHTDTRRADRR